MKGWVHAAEGGEVGGTGLVVSCWERVRVSCPARPPFHGSGDWQEWWHPRAQPCVRDHPAWHACCQPRGQKGYDPHAALPHTAGRARRAVPQCVAPQTLAWQMAVPEPAAFHALAQQCCVQWQWGAWSQDWFIAEGLRVLSVPPAQHGYPAAARSGSPGATPGQPSRPTGPPGSRAVAGVLPGRPGRGSLPTWQELAGLGRQPCSPCPACAP